MIDLTLIELANFGDKTLDRTFWLSVFDGIRNQHSVSTRSQGWKRVRKACRSLPTFPWFWLFRRICG